MNTQLQTSCGDQAWGRASGAARAFTLIEVLIAAFIIALGVIGLTALFAGAARQQQVASEITRSVSITKSAEAKLVDLIGRLSDEDSSIATAIDVDRWYAVPAHPDLDYLMVDFDGSGSLYFEAPAVESEVLLYERPADAGTQGVGILGARFDNPASAPVPYQGVLRPFGQRRVLPESIGAISVSYGLPEPPPVGCPAPPGVESFAFDGRYFNGNLNLPVYFGDGAPPPGALQATWQNYVVLDIQDTPVSGSALAQLHAINIEKLLRICLATSLAYLVVEKIEIDGPVPYRFKNDRLVSLADRMSLVGDARSEPDDDCWYVAGKRPSIGFSCVFRRTSADTSQLMVATYALQPAGRKGCYTPPESLSDIDSGRAPMREVDVTLAYDDIEERYFITTTADDDRFVLDAGQLVMFSGETITGPESIPGADAPVRVIRRVMRDDEERGYLDRSPRARGDSLLRERSQRVRMDAWVIQPSVQSNGDETFWGLSPVEFRVFQVQEGGL